LGAGVFPCDSLAYGALSHLIIPRRLFSPGGLLLLPACPPFCFLPASTPISIDPPGEHFPAFLFQPDQVFVFMWHLNC
jgi:hypothetical protein